jgi:CheY-like chemotaxis protein
MPDTRARLLRAALGFALVPAETHELKGYLRYSAIAEGASGYLMKPITPEQLGREIATRLAERRPERRRPV